MKMHVLGASLLVVLAVTVPTQTVLAVMIDGKQCAGMVSTQKNPKTNEVSRSCRTADGGIATEIVKQSKTKKKVTKPAL
jgi:hypothetical protein